MRVKRAKLVRKHIRHFRIVFGIEAPYDIILDGNFIFAALKFKVDIKDRLQKLLQGEDIRLHIMRSVLNELKAVGPKAKSAYDYAAQFCSVIEDGKTQQMSSHDNFRTVITCGEFSSRYNNSSFIPSCACTVLSNSRSKQFDSVKAS